MGQIELAGNPSITVTVRRSARARRLSLRMSQLDGRVTLTLPRGVPEDEGLAFLQSKEDWLRKHVAARVDDVIVGIGASLPFRGALHTIQKGTGRGIARSDETLHVGGGEDTASRRLQAWLKAQARDRLAVASDRYAQALGKPYARLTLRDTRSRWGSCTSDGGLMYSWRLIMTPPEILDYVAAHEVAHLEQMNHSDAFWAVVERLYGDWRPARNWLRTNGAGLHRYKF
ncbi:M48 family metallopeptidase [Thalassococcus lentus]|uniref:SprT family zinc-dependent metalloprotease n=1 Tax=Thalassococcus lentus TaxID=1210524 RepID=A0ABT4XV33_9RHOB|nr:SprT family zinc-dependent metalloprotease [Thalassococcus lentus]MDA7425828.1 SprT family zinc-dependent metalloprotease [Thalassococcus lentus]